MNNTVRIALAVTYAAVGIWALAPAPPKPLAATIAPPPPPASERPAPMPRPRIRPPEDEEPAYRGSSADEAPKPAALHPPETYTSAGFYPHGLAVEMDEADHWAIANLKIPQLPPVEFDHPVKGPVEVIDVETTDKLLEVCKGVNIPKGMIIIGCASRTPYLCRIYLGP